MDHLRTDKRHDFVVIYDVTNGNPNGDPDRDNRPRQNRKSGHGFVTDACIKRKIRNYLKEFHDANLYVDEGYYLSEKHKKAHLALGNNAKLEDLKTYMLQTYDDNRLFGAMMNTGKDEGEGEHSEKADTVRPGKKPKTNGDDKKQVWCGTVRGPIQISFADSLSPIYPERCSITRCAKTNATDGITNGDAPEDGDSHPTFGEKWIVPYAPYLFTGSYSPGRGEKCGVSSNDLERLWDSLEWCWMNDSSAGRPVQNFRGLWIFTHENKWGDAHADTLYDLVRTGVSLRSGIDSPRSFGDYQVDVPLDQLPPEISCFVSLPTAVGTKRAA